MKKIKNLFNFPNMDSAFQDEDCDELAVVVKIDLHELEYLIRHMVSAVENATEFSAVKYAMRFHDVLSAWRDDLVNAWPYRKKKAHEQHVSRIRLAEIAAHNETARERRKNDAGFIDTLSHPLDRANHDVTIYAARDAEIDMSFDNGAALAVVCSIHGTIHGTENASDARKMMADITSYCTECRDHLIDTKGKTA